MGIPLSAKKSGSRAIAPPTAKLAPHSKLLSVKCGRYGGMYGIPRAWAVVDPSNPLKRTSYKLEVIKDDRHITKLMDGYKKSR